MKTKENLSHDEAAKNIKNLKPFTITRGAKLEVRAIVRNEGILLTLENPNPSQIADDSIAIIIPSHETLLLTEWLQKYLSKSGAKNGKEGNGSGN